MLSPLFHCWRFCKHCVRSFYRENPNQWIWLYELERMPPLGRFEAGRGFSPDLSILLMFDEFVIDGEACERICASSTPPAWLGHWPEVLEVLATEGCLSTVETREEIKKVSAKRGAMLRLDMAQPEKWADAMMYYDNLMASADRALKDSVSASGDLNWEFNPKRTLGAKGPDGQYHLLSGKALTDPGDDPNDPHFQMHQMALDHLRVQLGEVNAALALSNSLGIAPMLWAPYKGYLKAKAAEVPALQKIDDRGDASRLFFKVAFPKYRPETVSQLSRLRRDKRIRQLREEIVAASKTGEVIDPEYPQRVLQEVLKVEKKVGRVRQISGWISSAVGSIPLPGVGLAATAVAEIVSRPIENRIRKNWNWFYLISDGTGHT